jgi:hypothetical protein
MLAKDTSDSRFLFAEDLLIDCEYKTVVVAVAEVIPPNTLLDKGGDTKTGKPINKYALRFEGKDKLLIIGPTNVSLARSATGVPLDKLVGKQLMLQVRIVEAFGDDVTAIRIIPPEGVMVRRGIAKRMGHKAVWKPGA